MTDDDWNRNRDEENRVDGGRRDFARFALAAAGGLLIGSSALAIRPSTRRKPRILTNNAYGNGATLPSRRMYFFYLTNPERTRAYFIERPSNRPFMESTIQADIEEAVRMVKGGLTPVGKGFGAFEFVHKSYFVAVMDEATEELVPNNAVSFSYERGGGNHSFLDGKDIRPFNNITGFYCFNYMRDRNTLQDLNNKSENFYISANHRRRGTAYKQGDKGHNDTATNTGPPLP